MSYSVLKNHSRSASTSSLTDVACADGICAENVSCDDYFCPENFFLCNCSDFLCNCQEDSLCDVPPVDPNFDTCHPLRTDCGDVVGVICHTSVDTLCPISG